MSSARQTILTSAGTSVLVSLIVLFASKAIDVTVPPHLLVEQVKETTFRYPKLMFSVDRYESTPGERFLFFSILDPSATTN
jgi:hypothetical protein